MEGEGGCGGREAKNKKGDGSKWGKGISNRLNRKLELHVHIFN
jgi:hypothetical protein